MFQEGGISLWEGSELRNHRLFCKSPRSNPVGNGMGVDVLGVDRGHFSSPGKSWWGLIYAKSWEEKWVYSKHVLEIEFWIRKGFFSTGVGKFGNGIQNKSRFQHNCFGLPGTSQRGRVYWIIGCIVWSQARGFGQEKGTWKSLIWEGIWPWDKWDSGLHWLEGACKMNSGTTII